jgi:hypothetical protein
MFLYDFNPQPMRASAVHVLYFTGTASGFSFRCIFDTSLLRIPTYGNIVKPLQGLTYDIFEMCHILPLLFDPVLLSSSRYG